MDSFEVNKILGAILGTCLGVLSINIAAGAIFTPVKPAKPGYESAVPEPAPAGKPAEPEKQEPIEQLLAKGRLRATLAMLGPAFVASIAYVDPGNFALALTG